MTLFSNIIAPLIAGLFFLLYFIYFTISTPSKAASYKYFLVFLVGISLFSLGRPLQLILGAHPVPLIIVNLRMMILCGLIAPVIILASELFNRSKRKGFQGALIAFCVLLGLVYVVFNTLGTRESHTLFHFAVITAQDNFTPSMQAPFYGREVTIVVQVIIGLLLAVFSLIKLVQLNSTTSLRGLFGNKIFLFNSGVLIFAVSFIVGSLAKQWGIYYVVSIVSALLFGGSVLIDIREVYHLHEKLIPFIKEDIIHNVTFSSIAKSKLTEMLDCLGKKADLNTFASIKVCSTDAHTPQDGTVLEGIAQTCAAHLRRFLDEDSFILVPLANGRIGIALRLLEGGHEKGGAPRLLEVLEDLQREINRNLKMDLAIGIGRSYETLDDLRVSYHEALHAQDHAERLERPGIVHVNTISEVDRLISCYPVKEKELVLSLVKVGDRTNSAVAFRKFMTKFRQFIAEKPESLKVRLYEFIGSLIDAAIIGGGDENKLNERMEELFADISYIKDNETLEKWLSSSVAEITATVAQVYESRSKALIREALAYMEQNHDKQLSYKDVSREVLISPSYFLSLFKQETGYTFVDSLTMIRIEKAKHLLISTDMNINQIAASTGFNNSNYFSRVFRNIVGLRARDYRLQAVTE